MAIRMKFFRPSAPPRSHLFVGQNDVDFDPPIFVSILGILKAVGTSSDREAKSMSNITQARRALITRILEGDGKASRAQRRAAFDNAGLAEPLNALIDKVTKHAYRVTDDDIGAARASGLSEDQIFEILVCAAIGQASRQHDTALAALEAATKKE